LPSRRSDLAGSSSGNIVHLFSEQAVLDAVAQFTQPVTRRRIAVFSGRSIKSSSFQAAFPGLVGRGLIAERGDGYEATPEGKAAAGVGTLPTGPALVAHWRSKLTPSEVKVFDAVLAAYPQGVSRAEVAARTGQSPASSSFQAAFPALRDLELIEGQRQFRASDVLFEG
jgi:hypothetical protein